MKLSRVAALALTLPASSMAGAEELKLPPEVTPALRAACEGDVRRLGCIRPSATYDQVKSCVIARYMRLGNRCKLELAAVGYSGPSNMPKSTAKASLVKAASE